MRLQIPAYTDRWMMGDRYGDVIAVVNGIARVRLDKSGKTVRVLLDDCTDIAYGTDGDNFDGSGEPIVYREDQQ